MDGTVCTSGTAFTPAMRAFERKIEELKQESRRLQQALSELQNTAGGTE